MMLQKIFSMASQCTGVAVLILLTVTTKEADMKAFGSPSSKEMARYPWETIWAYNGTNKEVIRTDHLLRQPETLEDNELPDTVQDVGAQAKKKMSQMPHL